LPWLETRIGDKRDGKQGNRKKYFACAGECALNRNVREWSSEEVRRGDVAGGKDRGEKIERLL
jgi:hypothetical protein